MKQGIEEGLVYGSVIRVDIVCAFFIRKPFFGHHVSIQVLGIAPVEVEHDDIVPTDVKSMLHDGGNLSRLGRILSDAEYDDTVYSPCDDE
jgi:hypothetical protein